ncbi:MAG: hypothetical protein CM1200mP13_15200 [Candidatus Pelagibacterales bacterium]|nr:MAG: hypothetical protein CM1200mP13_15200 [Pelagibacterales bacterium]
MGPTPRSYKKFLNKKMKLNALISTIAYKINEKKLFVLKDFTNTKNSIKQKIQKILLMF